MKKLLLALIFSLLIPLQASASVISDAATALSTGSFVEIPKTASYNLNSINGGIFVPTPEGPGCGSEEYILQFASQAAYDPINGEIRMLGQAHGGTTCYGGRFVRYTISSDVWDKRLFPPTWCSGGSVCPNHADHMWNAMNYATGKQYAWRSGSTYEYNPTANTWTDLNITFNSGQDSTSAMEYFPEMGKLVHCTGSWGCVSVAPASGATWIQIAHGQGADSGGALPSVAAMSAYNNWIVYNPVYHVMFLGGGTAMYKIDQNSAVTRMADCPAACELTHSVSVVDPVTGELLLFNGSTLYAYTPSSNTWRTTAASVPARFTAGLDGPGDGLVATPLSTYGVVWFAKFSGSSPTSNGVFIYKHAAGVADTTAPTAPSSLVATPVSSSQINLSWTASTDAVGVSGYLVERSPSGCGSFTQIGTPSGISFSDTGRTAATTYCYRVRATDAATNLSSYSSNVSAATLAADTTAPTAPTGLTLTVISPTQINLAWTASTDAVGVTGYQVERCSGASCSGFALVGSPSTNAYNDTSLSPSTSYSYRVRATDLAANLSSYSSTATASTTAATSGDFATRCAAAGVIRCFGFDTGAELGGTYGNNFGNFNNSGTCNGTTILCPVIDTTTKASGTGSMKFTQPSQSGAGAAGQWFTNFSTDLATQFGATGEFWIQWRQRFDDAYVNNVYTGGDGEGPKLANFSAGDSNGCTVANNTNCRSSNVDIELVMQNLSQRGYAQMYGYIEDAGQPQQFRQLLTSFGSDFKFQNARPTPFCLYSQNLTTPKTSFPPSGNCIGFFANEWMTFKVHVKAGTPSGQYWTATQIDLWIGREGAALQQAIAWTGNYGASSNKFGKVWFLPYITNKDATQVHTASNSWYDELIISTQNIADPSAGGGSVALVAPTSVAVTTP